MVMKKIRVLTIDDSILMSRMLHAAFEKEPDMELVGQAADGIEGLKMIEVLKPDVITLDVEMPGLNGLEFLERMMMTQPIPTVMLSSHTAEGTEVTLKALELGAFDFLQKPRCGLDKVIDFLEAELFPRIRFASNSKPQILRTTLSHLRQHAPERPASGNRSSSGSSQGMNRLRQSSPAESGFKSMKTTATSAHKIELIAIGSSTGGVSAIKEVIEDFPEGMPPVIITQHMPEGYTSRFADRLNRHCAMTVKEAQNGDILQTGMVYIAPGHSHLKIVPCAKGGFMCELWNGPLVSGHRPSVDVMFESVSQTYGDKALGVILTGMGKDGAQGLLKMRQKGSVTFGQNKETCVVYGMPKAAFEQGAVAHELPLEDIGNAVMNALSATQKTSLQRRQG
jgi:two-component system, chemotaxis family, protein-glutamate methylesterase/glutaminase